MTLSKVKMYVLTLLAVLALGAVIAYGDGNPTPQCRPDGTQCIPPR